MTFLAYHCDICRKDVPFKSKSVRIETTTKEGETDEIFVFCSWFCFKAWVNNKQTEQFVGKSLKYDFVNR